MIEKNEIAEIVDILKDKSLTISTAESLTGGLLSAKFVEVDGVSSVFFGGMVTYSDEMKILLGVKRETIENHFAVSKETSSEMAKAVMEMMKSDIGISTTGIAGKNTDISKKPVGNVFVSVYFRNEVVTREYNFSGNREEIKRKTVESALALLKKTIEGEKKNG